MTLNLRESLNFILKPALLLAGCLCMACSSGDKHVDDPDGPDNPGGGRGNGDEDPPPDEEPSQCFSFLANGAAWDNVEPYVSNFLIDMPVGTWNSQAPIFGVEVDVAVCIGPGPVETGQDAGGCESDIGATNRFASKSEYPETARVNLGISHTR